MKNPSLVVRHWTGEFNAILSDAASALSGWLTPLPEAAVTSNALTQIADIPNWLAFVVAASIEVTGISINAHYLDALEFNEAQELEMARTGRKTYKYIPENAQAARNAVVWYYGLTGFLVAATALYEVAVESAPLIKLLVIPFPVISAIGTITSNRRAAFHRKQASIAAETEAQSTAKRKSKPVADGNDTETEDAPLLRNPKPEIAPETQGEIPDYATATLDFYKRNPGATYTEAAQSLDCSPRTVSNHVKLLVAAGAIENNGHGIKVI